ncbi:MAG: T9SS type A sorting domain-containing protein, partial [Bacteroidales bacterium]|nr:T9SS type A sorting domain-containing protein [Bacteroidales bacterium]
GYPLFGDPEMIEVFDTFNIATCDSYDLDGITLTQSGTYTMHFVDSTDYLDSTVTLYLTLNYGDSIEVSDTVMLGQGYEGYGISLTAEQVSAAFGNDHSVDIRAMMYIDSLLTANGCDSLIFLTLYIVNENTDIDNSTVQQFNDVKIYPNPTRGKVNVEGDDMLSVEVYDNISRRVFEQKESRQTYIFDLSDKPAGSYYIRVRTSHGTVVKKLIKK